MIQLLLADDHDIMLDGYASILQDQSNITIVGKAHNGKEVITLLEHLSCDILLLDINMPFMDGVETARHLKRHKPSIKIIILSMLNNLSYIKELIAIGVEGYLLKNCDKHSFITAINAVYRNQKYFDETIQKILNTGYRTEYMVNNKEVSLSEREVEIIRMVALGMTSSEIASELFISPHTVKTHRKNVNAKLQITNPVELTHFAKKHGILPS